MRHTPPIVHLGRLAAVAALLALLLMGRRDAAAQGAPPDPIVSFEASNVGGQYIRHRNTLGEITLIRGELDQADATWVLRPALNGTPGAVSFESFNYPGTFLRHQAFRIKQHRNDGSDLFRQDASFHVRPGLIGGDTKTFEAINAPGHFIRHRNFELWIDRNDNSDLFRRDASFRQKAGFEGQVALNVPITLESINLPGRYIRHRFALGELTPVRSELDMADATWVPRPALNGAPGAVSFESRNYPGTFLRHQNFRIKQHRNDNSDLFKRDASFYAHAGLSGPPGGLSFEAVNVPGHFIRHQNGELWIANREAGDRALFTSDVTFRQHVGAGFRVSDREVSFESVNVASHYLRHRLALGELTRVDPASNLDRADATWIIRPALSGVPGAVSFESKNYPGTFLRHQGFRLKQQRDDGSDSPLFRMDASFFEKPALAGGSGKSFEAVNTPGHFIRHTNFQFWLAKDDGSDLFKRDASFIERRGLFIEPGDCTRFFRRWRAGYDDDHQIEVCGWVMGIEQYCAARNAHPAQEWQGNRRYLICDANWRESTLIEELEQLTVGIGQGLLQAYVAVAPFVGPIVSGLGCVNGVIYACATLALEIADLAGARPPGVIGEALDVADHVGKCVDGNIVACAQLGARGARAAGLTIPGEDAVKVAEDARKCADGEFAACVRLGLMAADAAGIPVGLGAGDLIDARDCATGETEACLALGGQFARLVNFPIDRLTGGAENARRCRDGDVNACLALGRGAAQTAGIPLGDLPQGVDQGRRCANGDQAACVALGRGAAQAAGLPLGGVAGGADTARRCTNGDQAACIELGRALVRAVG